MIDPGYYDERDARDGESNCIDCGAYVPARLGRPTRCRPCEVDRYEPIERYQVEEGA